jgi:hypothetical protein
MPDTFEPDDGSAVRRRMAVVYAIVALLLLATCCVGALWFGRSLNDVVTNLH